MGGRRESAGSQAPPPGAHFGRRGPVDGQMGGAVRGGGSGTTAQNGSNNRGIPFGHASKKSFGHARSGRANGTGGCGEIEDFVSAIRSSNPPLVERVPVAHLWASQPWGLGRRPRWPAKNHTNTGIGESCKLYLARLQSALSNAAKNEQTEDFVPAIRSLKPPMWRGFLWPTSGPALGPGAATLACQKSENHIIRHGTSEKWQVVFGKIAFRSFQRRRNFADRRLRLRHTELKNPLVERIPVAHLWASPGGWGGHAGLPKITKIISSDMGNREKVAS
eukprot:gene7929-biopygen13624